MRLNVLVLVSLLFSFFTCCVPIETISNQDFSSGIYKHKPPDESPKKIYLDVSEDSLVVYDLKDMAGEKKPDLASGKGVEITSIKQGNYLYGSKFSEISVDVDLSTVLTKLRPAAGGVPLQANTNLNAIIYLGTKNSIYLIRSRTSETRKTSSFIRHWGYDAGIFAGFGITPVNPTTTGDNITLEYDGVVFQKGIAGFITIEKLAIGIALGFDNLLDGNSKFWVYNNKPWIGIVLAIANF